MTPRPPMRSHNIRFTDDLWDAAQAKAVERGETLSEVIRQALERYVNKK